jgi:glycosyltransferase involved in cell wall biosynthesis
MLHRDRVQAAHFQYVAPPWCPCPTVVSVHDISYESHPEFFPARTRVRMRALVPRTVRSAAAVITISEFSRLDIAERYRVDPARIIVTPLAAAPHFHPLTPGKEQATLDRLGINGPYVLAVGNVQPRKNLVRLLEAFAAVRRRTDLPHRLVLVGRRAYRGDAILARQEALGIASHVLATGFVTDEDLVALYSGADVFAYPSLYEGFGLPVLEAMACVSPVLTSDTTALPEVVGDAAELVDPWSVSVIADALYRLLTTATLRDTLRDRGIRRALEFSWQRLAEQTLAVYKQAA